ncbi:neurogenic differentiation factor 1-like [Paramacrobiotus metropolitanus]|uniref:neurogenic differentiation factor 1-like n=1 Tax=Paramacrobiotus metropolitanus TaxID=2943436 RepID=UPI002445A12A|nr:neurogenic differentiation factor 1-like [Paramacrobiotus metropolitanus]
MTADFGQNGQPKKKRGPKKKVWPAQVRQQRQMARRNRANHRERQRMHGLNRSLDLLRNACPLFANQRLSKIDTLRLARNYIKALSQILENGKQPDMLDYARTLTKDLSQGTINLIAGHLQVSPHLLWYSEHVLYTSDPFLYPPTLPTAPSSFPFYPQPDAPPHFRCNPSSSHAADQLMQPAVYPSDAFDTRLLPVHAAPSNQHAAFPYRH